MTTDIVQGQLFDYASLDNETREFVCEKAKAIRARLKRTVEDVMAIGEDLLAVKARLPHGKFLPWLHAEFDLSERTAQNFMYAARKKLKSAESADLTVSLFHEPHAVIDRVISGQASAVIQESKGELSQAQEAERDEEEVFKAKRQALAAEGFYYIPEKKHVFDAIDAGIIEIDLEEDEEDPVQENLTPAQFVDEVFPGLREQQPHIVRPLTSLDDIFPGISQVQQVPESWKLPPELRGTPEKSATLSILQSSESNEWFTPSQYVDAARRLMGGIDVDPASNELANKVIQATTYYDIETNGFNKPWYGRVWLNPPYGKSEGAESNQELWSHRLMEQYQAGVTKEAILLVNANTEAKWFQPLYNYLICFTNHRIRFYNTGGDSSQPTQGNALIYFGNQEEQFISLFKQFGVIVRRVDSE